MTPDSECIVSWKPIDSPTLSMLVISVMAAAAMPLALIEKTVARTSGGSRSGRGRSLVRIVAPRSTSTATAI
jgi:hypothetical protein